MCGIVGYVGPRSSGPLLLDALKRLEYRGYDSCGIAVLDNGTPKLMRAAGKIAGLEAKVLASLPDAHDGQQCGIGHTRWATHGRPCEQNSHPHVDCAGRIFVVHNGIVENHLELRRRLEQRGHRMRTQTDSEVLPHLIESHFTGNLEDAVRASLDEIEGIYAFVAVCVTDGLKVVAARQGPPLVIGVGDGECFIASDAPALLPFTRQLLYLENGEVATLTASGVRIVALDGRTRVRKPQQVLWTAETAEKEGYPHFTHAGPEIGVASTKAFTTQLALLHLLAVFLGRARGALDQEAARRHFESLLRVPDLMTEVLEQDADIAALARRLQSSKGFLYLIALVDADLPAIVVVPRDQIYRKTVSNIEEVRVRDARVYAVATTGDDEIELVADSVLRVPATEPLLSPLLTVLPLQLLAYRIGVRRGLDVDQPRNLAKSVTVE